MLILFVEALLRGIFHKTLCFFSNLKEMVLDNVLSMTFKYFIYWNQYVIFKTIYEILYLSYCWDTRKDSLKILRFLINTSSDKNLNVYFRPLSLNILEAEVFLIKCMLKICNKFTAEHPCQRVISVHSSAWVFSCKFAAYF